MPSESSKVNEHAVVHPYYLPRSAPPTKLSFMRLPTSLKGRLSEYWSALPDLNRSPVSDEAFVLLRELSRQCLEEIQRGRTATTRQLLSMLAEVRG